MKNGFIVSGKKIGYPHSYVCCHYKAATVSNGKVVDRAETYLGSGSKCRVCGIRVNGNQKGNLNKLVEGLNNQRSESELARLLRGVPISEITVLGPFRKTENEAYIDGKSLPVKNILKKIF